MLAVSTASNDSFTWLKPVSVMFAVLIASCGGGAEAGNGESTLAESGRGTTLPPVTSTKQTESEVTTAPETTLEVPDPCSLLTVEEAVRYDSSITSANEPTIVAGATTRTCDYGALSVSVAPGGPADSLRYEGMGDDRNEAVGIAVAGATGAVAYLSDGAVSQVAAAGEDHSVLILLWTDAVTPDSPELEQLRQLLELAFSRL